MDNSKLTREDSLHILQLRCQVQRQSLAREAKQIKSSLGLLDSVGDTLCQVKSRPKMIALFCVVAASIMLIKPKRLRSAVQIGWQVWTFSQKFLPLARQIKARFSTSS